MQFCIATVKLFVHTARFFCTLLHCCSWKFWQSSVYDSTPLRQLEVRLQLFNKKGSRRTLIVMYSVLRALTRCGCSVEERRCKSLAAETCFAHPAAESRHDGFCFCFLFWRFASDQSSENVPNRSSRQMFAVGRTRPTWPQMISLKLLYDSSVDVAVATHFCSSSWVSLDAGG